jgi:hypothetical protein
MTFSWKMLQQWVVPALLVNVVIPLRTSFAAEKTDWFCQARWGVMTTYLADPPGTTAGSQVTAETWNKQVEEFDVPGLTGQLASVGTKYLLLSIGQNSGHFCAPNATYDKIVGIRPSRCSRRDLVADLAEALHDKGIRLMVYLPSGAPGMDATACAKLGWQPGPVGRLAEFQRNWEAVIREWSVRWGKSVSGWWLDGCYYPEQMYRFPQEPNSASFAAALKAGNPEAIVAFNPGVAVPVAGLTKHEDYSAGEVNLDMLSRAVASCRGRWLECEGAKVQYHILTYLGTTWCAGERPVWSDDAVIAVTRQLAAKGGVVTYDVPIQKNGLIPQPFCQQLRAVGQAIK